MSDFINDFAIIDVTLDEAMHNSSTLHRNDR